ncbi:MAG: hypothetical protein AAI978_00200 [Candidatus Hodgkinia cicadicola]
MLAKLVRVLKRLLIANTDANYLVSLVAKNGALHEFMGDSSWSCSFWSKQLEALTSSEQSTNCDCINHKLNSAHPVSLAECNAFDILSSMGFEFYNTDEICDIEDNFYALNFSKLHPSLDSKDSFYVFKTNCASVLRTHTTSSLIKMLKGKRGEFKSFTIGKVYRNDNSAKHLPCFIQVEGIVCERRASLASVVGLVKRIVCKFLGTRPWFRLRRAYFPFTEPSLEIDISKCTQFSSIKHNYGWLEVVGLGLIKREVLINARSCARYVYAFGLGLERLTMLKLGLNDIRLLYTT